MVREKDSWLREAETKLGQRFRNRALLRAALTHPSVGPEGRAFERLEFLGDARNGGQVLNLDISLLAAPSTADRRVASPIVPLRPSFLAPDV